MMAAASSPQKVNVGVAVQGLQGFLQGLNLWRDLHLWTDLLFKSTDWFYPYKLTDRLGSSKRGGNSS